MFSAMPQVEVCIVRRLHDAIYTLMREAFEDALAAAQVPYVVRGAARFFVER